MKQAIIIPVLLASLVGWVSSASAEMYKWIDSQGKTHYSATPPAANIKAENIEAEINLFSAKPKNANTPDTNTTASKITTKTPINSTVKPEEAAKASEQQHRDYCDQQQQALEKLSTNSLVKYSDEDGERFLTAAEKQQKIATISKNIEMMCRPEMFSSPNGLAIMPAPASANAGKTSDK